ncbi:unnamed protein product [Acanthoscelides obtectus]|uniref:Uncharacterized protein n=1 Tax=Acanthoscelides obtectus TaxID=200917 RepID=A0A9P0VTP8_ACAOB|nr:unnamed protein product [Acanthoscelides obtectus]CAK1682919.1 hypothetical protein AOBTE_LOCUS33990 [Acanthoscelides obtectus]
MLQEASELMKETCSTTPAKKKKVENKAKDMIEKTRNEREAMALLAFSDVDDTLIDHDYGVCVTVDVDTENNNKSVQDVGTAKQISVQDVGTAKQISVQDVGTAKQISVQDVGTAKQISVQDVGTAKQISAPRTKRMNKVKH